MQQRGWQRTGLVVALLSAAPLLLWSVGEQGPRRFVDLAVYQQAGRTVLDGGDLYGFTTERGLPFTYPPFAALLALPVGHLPVVVAGLLWAAMTLAALAFVVHRCSVPLRSALARLGARGALLAGGLVGVALWLQPLRDTVRFGQVGVLLAALVVADLLPERTRWPRGLLVGIAAAVKLTPALFVVYLLVSGQRRAAAVATATAAGLTLLAAAVLPGATRTYWTDAVFDLQRIGDVADGGNQALRGMLVRTGWPDAVQVVVLVAAVVALLAVGLVRAARARDRVAAVAIVGCLSVAVSPIGWIHHLVWLVPAALVLAGDLRSRRRVLLAVGLVAMAAARLPWQAQALLLDGAPGRPLWLLVQSALGLAAVAVVLWLPTSGQRGEDLVVEEPVAAHDRAAVGARDA